MTSSSQNNRVSILLTAKISIPRLKANLVIRQHLIDRLNEGLLPRARLVLLSAPTGYGKTTLACQWLSSKTYYKLWFSLDEKDNDPQRFLTYLLAAFYEIIPKTVQAVQNSFGLEQLPPVNALIYPLIDDLVGLNERVVLVLDDYHLIYNRYIHDIIQYIIDYTPPSLDLVLITREDPPLTLGVMRDAGEVIEIRASDLRFSEDETAVFMSITGQLSLESEVIALLNIMTEGWIAGLQLAAFSMRGRTTDEIIDFLLDFSSSHRYIIDYLVLEVFTRLPKGVCDFLKQTAALDFLCAPLGNAVTGIKDSQAFLELLEQSNLFFLPLDDEHYWYRNRNLLTDSLCKELSRAEQQIIHQKVARWYESNDYLGEAVAETVAAAKYQATGDLIESSNNWSYDLSANGLNCLLSKRELELFRLVAAGLSNEEIARELAISLSTTKWHLHNIFSKLGVKSRTQAIVKAKKANLI